jgi:hypothetical protein
MYGFQKEERFLLSIHRNNARAIEGICFNSGSVKIGNYNREMLVMQYADAKEVGLIYLALRSVLRCDH